MSPFPRWASRSFAFVLVVSSLARADVPADLTGDAAVVELSVRGAPRKNLRVHAGGAAILTLTGPGRLVIELREEALAPRQEAFLLEQDGKPVAPQQLNAALDPAVRSEKGLAVSRPMSIPVTVAAGQHVLKLQWPGDAAGDALVEVSGAAIAPPLPALALPLASGAPLPGAKPLDPRPAEAKPVSLAQPVALALPLAPAAAPQAVPALAPLTGASAAPALADQGRPKVLLPDRGPAPQELAHRFSLDLRAGADRSAEGYTAPVALGRIGAQVAYRALPLLPVMLDFDLGFSRQEYQARQIGGDGHSLAQASLDERRADTALTAGYDFGPWLRRDGRLSALPFLGVQYSALRNGGFPLDLLGVAAGLHARWELSSALALQGGFRWAYNLLKGSTLSAVGTPVSDLLLQAGLSLPLPGGYALDAGYRGDLLALTYDTRVSHGMSLGVHTQF